MAHCQTCHGTGYAVAYFPKEGLPPGYRPSHFPLNGLPCVQCGGSGFSHCCDGEDVCHPVGEGHNGGARQKR
jgi:hypothetical protein